MLSRRELVGKLAAGAAVAGVAKVGWANTAAARGMANGATAAVRSATLPLPAADQTRVPPGIAAAEGPTAPVAAMDAGAAASTAPPWELVRPLVQGSRVAHGWRVAGLSSVADGSCVLTLQNGRGRTQRVHLCRNDGRPEGLVYTDRLDLVVMNGGQGDLPTDEGLAQAVAAVAHVVATNEREAQHHVVALLPQAERVRRFTGEMERKLR